MSALSRTVRVMGPTWSRGNARGAGIVNLAARGMLVVLVARQLRSEGPLLAYCGALPL
jgi:hypothetical protein